MERACLRGTFRALPGTVNANHAHRPERYLCTVFLFYDSVSSDRAFVKKCYGHVSEHGFATVR